VAESISLNVHETNYNIMLCYLMLKNHQKAVDKINEIIREAPGKYQKHFFILRGLLYEEMGQSDKASKDLQKYEKQEPMAFDAFFKEGKDLVFEPFPIKNRLCSKFEYKAVKHLVPKAFKGSSKH
jgi:tetratricopeptide (TPR) repeat protein